MPMRFRRGYALMAVIIITVLILSGASILLLIGRDASIAGIQEKRSTEAHSISLAGLQWMLANLNSSAGRDAAVEIALSGGSFVANPADASARNVWAFNANDRFVGIPGPPPAIGSSTVDWTAFGTGHYGMTAAIDPLDTKRSILIRSIGVAGDMVVVLEANLQLNIVQTVPSGITGCFPADFQISYYDQEGPYDYTGNFRLDGGLGVPMAISSDHNRINGLAREASSTSPTAQAVEAGYTEGRKWRGTQTLRGTALPSNVSNRFGGTQSSTVTSLDDNIGPLPLWERNRYIANDPRIVDSFSAAGGPRGLGLNAGGMVFDGTTIDGSASVIRQRGLPLIAYISAPGATNVSNAAGGFITQSNWGGVKDDKARKGFYACDNHGGGNAAINETIEVCAKGSTGTGAPDWSNNAVNHSGRAHGFIQSILRQCTGSGGSIDPVTGSPFKSAANLNGIKCSGGFEWLENVAACLVLPRSVVSANGTNTVRAAGAPEDAVGPSNNFAACHPGCLIATDLNGDDAITNEDRPFRSSCINLDASTMSAYGPGLLPAKGGGSVFNGTYDPATGLGDPYAGQWLAFNAQLAATDANNSATSARFLPADKSIPALLGGAVRERGNDTLITRLDMSDRGPLGTCEQNCLAYGFGKDVTYGAHRTDLFAAPGVVGTLTDANCTAKVPSHTAIAGTVIEHCNWDRDGDGLLDRKSYALSSSYREECADPHDGVAWAPAFNISSANTMLGGAGCKNDLPTINPTVKAQRIVPFCENGNDEELRAGIDALSSVAKDISSTNINKNTTDVADGDGWFGGAKCHMGTTTTFGGVAHSHTGTLSGLPTTDVDRLGHPDFWIEDSCPNPVVLRVSTSANLSIGKVCGCGILILPGQSLQFGSTSTLMWRGLVIWDLKGSSGKELKMDGSGTATLVIEGGLLIAGDQGIEIKVTKAVGGGATINNASQTETVKQLFHMNPQAISDAFAAVKAPVRSIRRVQ